MDRRGSPEYPVFVALLISSPEYKLFEEVYRRRSRRLLQDVGLQQPLHFRRCVTCSVRLKLSIMFKILLGLAAIGSSVSAAATSGDCMY